MSATANRQMRGMISLATSCLPGLNAFFFRGIGIQPAEASPAAGQQATGQVSGLVTGHHSHCLKGQEGGNRRTATTPLPATPEKPRHAAAAAAAMLEGAAAARTGKVTPASHRAATVIRLGCRRHGHAAAAWSYSRHLVSRPEGRLPFFCPSPSAFRHALLFSPPPIRLFFLSLPV